MTVAEAGRLGGKARARQLDAVRRSQIAAELSAARWAGKPPVACPVCGHPARSIRALQAHKRSVHPGQRAKPLETLE